jgi:hypothetical protein
MKDFFDDLVGSTALVCVSLGLVFLSPALVALGITVFLVYLAVELVIDLLG